MEGINFSKEFPFITELFSNTLLPDNKIFIFEDYEVVSRDNVEMFLSMFQMSNPIYSNFDYRYFRVINDKFLLVIEDFKTNLKSIFLDFIVPNRKEVLNKNSFSSLFLLYNLILIFSPEFGTIYNIKKEIISHLHRNRKFPYFNRLIISEFIFINLLNKKHRKSCVSWDYRKFIANFVYSEACIEDCYIYISSEKKGSISELNQIYEMKNKTLIDIFSDNLYDDTNNNFTQKFFRVECILLNDINDFSVRNYYLWNYIIFLFHKSIYSNFSLHNSLFTLIFSIFTQNPSDYSAFSFIVNHLVRISIGKNTLDRLIEYFNLIMNSKYDNKGYLKELISIMLNKFKYI